MSATPPDDVEFEALLEYLRQNRGFDFTAYKRPSLYRRMKKRLDDVGIKTWADYTDRLEVEPDEFIQLFNTVLINVTSFFRDPPAWDYLSSQVVPQIIENSNGGPIRAWSAGCASGEEAYTIAMVFAEALGAEEFLARVKIYATDVDEDALVVARQGRYTHRDIAAIPNDLAARYFEPHAGGLTFRPNLRHSIIFGRHDLLRDPPLSRLDLLACRNAMMYFNAQGQARVIGALHFALKDTGFLFLGRAEMLLTRTDFFAPVALKHRVFARVPGIVAERIPGPPPAIEDPPRERAQRGLHEAAVDASPTATIIVDRAGALIAANGQVRAMFGLRPVDIGRPLRDLEISYRPVELRSRIEEVAALKRTVHISGVERAVSGGELQTLEIELCPLLDAIGLHIGTSVTFADVTPISHLNRELLTAKHELETAYEELQSSNEELETTNEELQSTVEELETTNEELQATNEELETLNEELQSTNTELQTMNDEMQERTADLDRVGAFLGSILNSVRLGVVVVDAELRVTQWSGRSEDLWGLRAQEAAGMSFLEVDIGLPTSQLKQVLEAGLAGDPPEGPVVIAATNRRGKAIRCSITCTPLRTRERVEGVVLLMEEQDA